MFFSFLFAVVKKVKLYKYAHDFVVSSRNSHFIFYCPLEHSSRSAYDGKPEELNDKIFELKGCIFPFISCA